jgi:glycosyltransferase involved in cell wall biosynthesis
VSRSDVDRWVASGAIEYLGTAGDVRPALGDAHVLVLPSYREGTPRSVLEAMSMGRAVITTDAPGCRDTVVDGESGLIVPVRDDTALADAALRLVTRPELVRRLGAAARQRAEHLYDARLIAAEMLKTMRL